jgi:ABC-type multidrug transport system fused ATPase/permease subunit
MLADNNKIDQLWTGKANSVLQRGIDSWVNFLQWFPGVMTETVIGLISAFIVIFTNVWIVGTVFTIVLAIISFYINQIWNKKTARLRKEVREYVTQSDRDIVRMIMSKSEVLQSDKLSYEEWKMSSIFLTLLWLGKNVERMRIRSFDTQRVTFALIQISLVSYVARWFLHWQYTLWVISIVWMLSNLLSQRIMDLNEYITAYYQVIISVEKLRETFDDVKPIVGFETAHSYRYIQWDISFNDVTYSYDGWDDDVVRWLSLQFHWQRKTALVWVSGSGKSTLIKLLAGYLHPQSGTVLIDNQELPNEHNLDRAVSLKSYYPHIGYLTQEPNVFDWSIRENLLYATTGDVTDDQLNTALEQSQCQFVFEFKDWLDTEIGEKWVRLSGWQRQRLAIAKIMLKNPKIVLLDEPTSALDSISEEAITKALDNLFQWRTVVIVAHRLQTVKKADDIIVLDKGQIIERGTHDALVAQEGQYAKMLELQSGF